MSVNRYNFKALSAILKDKIPQHFDILPHTSIKCIIHPSVIFTILDAYLRRDEDQTHVIGTLMGSAIDTNLIEISDCFVDKHSLNEGVKKKKKKKIVDAALESGFLNIKAYVQLPINMVKEYFVHFHEIQTELLPCNVERAEVLQYREKVASSKDKDTNSSIGNNKDNAINNDMNEISLKKLLIMLKHCKSYVQDVIDKKKKGNPGVGRYLHKVLSNDTFLELEKFDSINESILQDKLMISYLSNLAHLQFLIAEKLNASSMQ
ncbi:eukaryotic translation initiation factor 3 subunit F, putative [Plasmodium malariae]|uniref:Eukaryotic translation initiation factor 3 subunit F, putative n=1 Tax=Plasmodium malariae TaxID=5858 RepID=A0A1C3KBM3_PLAMA|nr:eukaryotic translation initiation factor 3 subunit F, putative [Plasmodium malariae]